MSSCLHPPDGKCRVCLPPLKQVDPARVKRLQDYVIELLQSRDSNPKAWQREELREEEQAQEDEEKEAIGEEVKLQAYEHRNEWLRQMLCQVSNSISKDTGCCISKSQKVDRSALLVKSAEDLQDKFSTFEALLAKCGETPDEATRERLNQISSGLASIVLNNKPQEEKNDDCVVFHLNATTLRGSVGTFRDAHVDFQEKYIVISVVDCDGNTWTLRSNRFPGDIITDESRFMLNKNGKDLRITLKKGNAEAPWHEGCIILQETVCVPGSSSNARSTRSCSTSQKARVLVHGFQKSTAGKRTGSASLSEAKGCTVSACSSFQNNRVHIRSCRAPAGLATSCDKALTKEEEAKHEQEGSTFFQ